MFELFFLYLIHQKLSEIFPFRWEGYQVDPLNLGAILVAAIAVASAVKASKKGTKLSENQNRLTEQQHRWEVGQACPTPVVLLKKREITHQPEEQDLSFQHEDFFAATLRLKAKNNSNLHRLHMRLRLSESSTDPMKLPLVATEHTLEISQDNGISFESWRLLQPQEESLGWILDLRKLLPDSKREVQQGLDVPLYLYVEYYYPTVTEYTRNNPVTVMIPLGSVANWAPLDTTNARWLDVPLYGEAQ